MDKEIIPYSAIQTKTHWYDYDHVNSNKFLIEDFAHALNFVNRFGGHTNHPYSVLKHLILCLDLIARKSEDLTHLQMLYVFIHDLHEAVYPDVTRPLKRLMREKYGFDINELTDEFDTWMYVSLQIPYPTEKDLEIVKYYDNWSLLIEKTYLLNDNFDWGWGEEFNTNDPFFEQFFEQFFLDPSYSHDFWVQLYVATFTKLHEAALEELKVRNGTT